MSVPLLSLRKGLAVAFRENFSSGQVNVFVNDGIVPVYRNGEYRSAAAWVVSRYGLTEEEMMRVYRDYKDDYDSQ